jgi:hypothetical protein
MKDMLTIAEIKRRYDSEWVLLQDPVTDDSMEVLSGKVLFHSGDRDEIYRRAVKLRPRRFAVLYVGRLPKDAAVVL